MGNAAFSLNVGNGHGGGVAWIGASVAPGSSWFGGAQILIDLNPINNFLIAPVPLSGPAGVAGAGAATYPSPLTFPVTPSLAGLQVYAQALIDEGNGAFSATNGLAIKLTMPPRIIVGTSVGGPTPVYVVDPTIPLVVAQWNTGTPNWTPAPINNVTDAAFAHGGRRAYFGQSLGNAVQELNLETNPPTWSTFTAAGRSTFGIGIDGPNNRLYTFEYAGSNVPTGELVAYDCDLTSPTYGSGVGSTVGLAASHGYIERWELSPDGKRAAVLGVFSRLLILVDTDPTSPNYMGWTNLGYIPGSGMLATGCDFTPDGLQIIVTIQVAGSAAGEVARYDVLLGMWHDHNPTVPGNQNIGVNSLPPANIPSAPWEPEVAPDGSFAAISGWNSAGGIGRLDLDPNNPFFWAYTPFLSPVSLAGSSWACAVSPESSQIATFGSGSLLIFNVDGSFFGSVPLPSAGNVYTITWHR